MTMQNFRRWRVTNTVLWRLLLAISLLLVTFALGRAQQPVPAPTDIAAADENDVEAQDQTSAVDQTSAAATTVIEFLAETNPQTPSELLRAVLVLQPLAAYEEAQRYLASLTSRNLAAGQLAALHAEFGSGRLVGLARDKGLAPAGRELAMSILKAARENKRDPQRIRSLIASLGDDLPAQRRAAGFAIAEAGAAAVPLLLDALRELPAGVSRDEIGRALARIGPRAEGALIAAVGGSEPLLQTAAVKALGYAGSKRSIPHLWRPYLVGGAGAQPAARAALRRLDASPPTSVTAATAMLRRHVLRHLGGEPPLPANWQGYVELWTWSADTQNVILSRLSARDAAAVAAARLARDIVELDPSAETTRLLLISRMEVDQRLGGMDQPLLKGPGSAYQLAATAGIEAINQVLVYSLDNELDAAAVAAAELLGDLGDESLLFGTRKAPLVAALQAANRRVRYAAARAIMSIDPRRAYPGSSHLLETLATLARAGGRPRALVGSPHQRIASKLTSSLAGLGFSARQATNGKDFLRTALDSSDFDVFFVSDAFRCPPASETLQQLRKDPQSKSVPVILLAREGRLDAAERLAARDDLVIVMPEFADRATLLLSLEDAAELASETSVPAARRLEQARDALQWITHLARYSQTYSWYDFSRVQSTAETVAFIPELSDDAVDLLGYLGAEAAQKMLVNTTSQTGASRERRLQAANAFTEAVLRHGLMLRQADIFQIYKRYNASTDADRATREILKQLLDTVETQ